jgi:hypothetical protein
MPAVTNERIRQMVFDAKTDPTDKFIVLALQALLESQVGAGATDTILDTFIPVGAAVQAVLYGHKLGDYAGLSRAQLKATFTFNDVPLNDAQVDAIFTALGATTGLSTPNPFGGASPETPGTPSEPAKEEQKTETESKQEPSAKEPEGVKPDQKGKKKDGSK